MRDGLYKKLAIACQAAPMRDVSFALVAKALGAVPKRGAVHQAIHSGGVRAYDMQRRVSQRMLLASGTFTSNRALELPPADGTSSRAAAGDKRPGVGKRYLSGKQVQTGFIGGCMPSAMSRMSEARGSRGQASARGGGKGGEAHAPTPASPARTPPLPPLQEEAVQPAGTPTLAVPRTTGGDGSHGSGSPEPQGKMSPITQCIVAELSARINSPALSSKSGERTNVDQDPTLKA